MSTPKLDVKLVPFDTNPNYYYLEVNGESLVALVPQDFIKLIDAMGKAVDPQHAQRLRDAVNAVYQKEN